MKMVKVPIVINQTYDMYFANDGSDLSQVIKAITNNVAASLKGYLAAIRGYQNSPYLILEVIIIY